MSEEYIIEPGDSLSRIARDHGVTLGELLVENPKFCSNGRDPDLVYPGEAVSIPAQTRFDPDSNLKTGVQGCKECPTSVTFSHVATNPDCALAQPTTEMPAVIALQRTERLKAIILPKDRFRYVTFQSTKPTVATLKPNKPDSDTQILEVETKTQGDTEIQTICKGKILAALPLRAAQFQLPLLVAQSARRPGFNADGTQAADMRYGDYTEQQIKDIDWKFEIEDKYRDMSTVKADVYFANMRRMATDLFSMGDLQKNIESMIDHFEASTGTDYSSPVLTETVRNHASTQRFFDQIYSELQLKLAMAKGDINALKTLHEIELDGRPRFNEIADILSGLTITINDTWAYDIYIDDYSPTGGCWTGTFRVVLWDHFGLDEPDVDESKNYNWLAGFRSWFILQHLDRFAYRPFRTKIALGGNQFQGRIQE